MATKPKGHRSVPRRTSGGDAWLTIRKDKGDEGHGTSPRTVARRVEGNGGRAQHAAAALGAAGRGSLAPTSPGVCWELVFGSRNFGTVFVLFFGSGISCFFQSPAGKMTSHRF